MVSISFKAKVGEVAHELVSDELSTILSSKTTFENVSGIPASNQRWIYQGKILGDDLTLKEAGIKDGYVVHVIKSSHSPAPKATTNPQSSLPPTPSLQTQRNPITSAATRTPQSSSIPASATIPAAELTRNLDSAIAILCQNSDVEVVKNAVSLLVKITNNIVNNPLEEKYRKLNRTTAAFSSKLGNVPGGEACMAAVGFTRRGDEWILIPSPIAWDVVVECYAKLDKFAKRLGSLSTDAVPQATAASPSTHSVSDAAALLTVLSLSADQSTTIQESPENQSEEEK